MAKRIATEYVHARFELSSSELSAFIVFMEEQQLHLQVLILENGNQSIVIEDLVGHEAIRMTFERHYDGYVCELSCRIVELQLTNAMRKAVSAFRGNAIVNRIYSHYTMEYQYKSGGVHRIVEKNDKGEHTVFEKKNNVQKIQRVFDRRIIEREINNVHLSIDEWLDLRNQASNDLELDKVDEQLQALTFKLFTLEAN